MSKRAHYERYPIEFQRRAVARMQSGEKASQLARELGVARSSLYCWERKCQGRAAPPRADREVEPKERRIRELQGKITQLEAMIGRQQLELDFFGAALRRVQGRRARKGESAATAFTPKSAAGRRKAN